MDAALLDIIVNGGLTGALTVAVIVLWRENRRLTDKVEQLRGTVASLHALTLANHALQYDQDNGEK